MKTAEKNIEKKKKIAVIASRLRTIDDDAIEAEKWIDKYLRLGYEVHLISGKFGEPTDLPKLEIPQMDYKHSEVRGIKRIMFGNVLDKSGRKAAYILLNSLVNRIYPQLKRYISANKIDMLSIENILGNMKNPALNVAMRSIVKDTGLPTISRNHTFQWNEEYFEKNNNFPDLIKQTPPDLKNIIHVTNSTNAQEALIEKMKIKSIVIPNTVDVDHLQRIDDYNRDFREAFGIKDDQFLFLQPTRINRKKCVERSIKLVKEINEATKKDHVLMITGSPVYFRGDYFEEVIRKINKAKINAILAHDRIFISRHQNKDQKFYSIDDAYLNADMVLFPSQSEDFGLPVLYAMAYKKPLFVNKYPNLKDILEKEPRFILMDGKMTNETVSDVFEVLHNKQKREEMIAHNFEMINKHYNSDLLDDKIVPLLNKFEKKSFIKRLKTRFFTRRPVHEKAPHKNEANNAAKTAENKEVKNENLKNRKGGYKEPVKS